METSPGARVAFDLSTPETERGLRSDLDTAPEEPRGFTQRGRDLSKIFTASVIILLLLAVFAVVVSNVAEDRRPELFYESAKFIMQLAVVVLAGHFLIDLNQRRRSKKTAANDFRKFLMRSLTSAYTGTKKARRLLRASCVAPNGSPGISFDLYEKHMTALNDAQLELEVLAREVRIFSKAFSDAGQAGRVYKEIRGMENYLRELVHEFESAKQSVDGAAVSSACLPVAPDAGLSKLHAFIQRRRVGTFREGFSSRYDAAIEVILDEGLKV